MAKTYLVAVVTTIAAGLLAIAGGLMANPDGGNALPLIFVVGFTGTTLTSVLAYLKAQETHLSVNSRLDEMVRNARLVAHAEGLAQGQIKGARAANLRTDEIRKRRRHK